MTPPHLEAHHHLVHKLLVSPDQAATILDNQPTLVKPQLLQVMLQVSYQIQQAGFPTKAHFLRTLVAQLKHELMSPEQSQDNESMPHCNHQWQLLHFRVQQLSSSPKTESHHLLEREKISRSSKWMSLLMVIAFLLLAGGVLFHRASGASIQDKKSPHSRLLNIVGVTHESDFFRGR